MRASGLKPQVSRLCAPDNYQYALFLAIIVSGVTVFLIFVTNFI